MQQTIRPIPSSDKYEPGSPAWLRTITPSKVATICDASRFQDQYTLWHEMAGLIEPKKPDAKTQDQYNVGHAAELAARAYWLLSNPGWRVSATEVQYEHTGLGFPARATIDGRATRGAGRHKVVEYKTARDKYEFGDDGTDQVPDDYLIQVTTQQIFTGFTAEPANLVLWPDYGRPKIYTIPFDQDLADMILAACAEWHRSLQDGTPPSLNDTVTCYETVRRLHPAIDGTTVQVDHSDAAEYLNAIADAKSAEARARRLKSEMCAAMADAQYAAVGEIVVADRRVNKHGISLYPRPRALDQIAAASTSKDSQ